jgi:hypothetical protein
MKSWDILEVTVSSNNTINMLCTDPSEINRLCDYITTEGNRYFTYVKTDKKHELEISKPLGTIPASHALIYIRPNTGLTTPKGNFLRYENVIHPDDVKFFILKYISTNGWFPYPGDGAAERFIKYHE